MLAPAAQQLYVAARARVFAVKAGASPQQFPVVWRVLEPSAKWQALMQVQRPAGGELSCVFEWLADGRGYRF
jgi:hypothetical protein